MKFETLNDAQRAYEDLLRGLETLQAAQVSGTVIMGALMATHPRYDQFQLYLTGAVEMALGGPMGQALTERQREQVREFVEQMQRVREVPAPTPPIVR